MEVRKEQFSEHGPQNTKNPTLQRYARPSRAGLELCTKLCAELCAVGGVMRGAVRADDCGFMSAGNLEIFKS